MQFGTPMRWGGSYRWRKLMELKEVKSLIREYVQDHYKYYGFYPYDVEVGNVLYSYEQYMDILSMTV